MFEYHGRQLASMSEAGPSARAAGAGAIPAGDIKVFVADYNESKYYSPTVASIPEAGPCGALASSSHSRFLKRSPQGAAGLRDVDEQVRR